MFVRLLTVVVALSLSAPALASDDFLEGWFEGTVSVDLDKANFVQVQTQQRFRGDSNPTGDLHLYRLWYGHKFGKVTAATGIQRSKEGADRETRLIQQASYSLGRLKARTRLEQRFFDGAPQTAWRLRQRLGTSVPLSNKDDGWALAGNVEGFWTLRATTSSGQTGITGVRTFAGFERSFGKLDLSVGYTRNQSIRKGAADRVGHAPTVNLTLNL